MEDYMKKYDQLDKRVIYHFTLGQGGIGDCIKFFVYLLQLCIHYNYKLHYLIQDIPIEQLLILKEEKMYIHSKELSNPRKIVNANDIPLITIGDSIVTPDIFHSFFYNELIDLKIEDVFDFTHLIKENVPKIMDSSITKYMSVHLRLGDKYLETDKEYVLCKNDVRLFSEFKLFDFLEKNETQTILFFCDNYEYKQRMKKKYKNLILTNSDIGHTSLSNTTYKQILDSVTEFYIMIHSEKIVAVSPSGFSEIASKFKKIPLLKL